MDSDRKEKNAVPFLKDIKSTSANYLYTNLADNTGAEINSKNRFG